ncbi:hypothetical protein QYE76_018644 [Lolium multiflorum]|uniref:Uncharacterized protein n=1 Tax=Lolium multiflorum TaxID=4521 RepID=A0AAD8VED6_LOLMU|nr:hypothetical protein QYE76_018644 [Lolium multiflorum]
MENYSLLMGAAAVMKMAVEMAAVSMEKPSGGTSPSGRVPEQRLLSPILASRWRRLWKVSRTVASSVRVFDAGALYRRKGSVEGRRGDDTIGWRGQGPAAPPYHLGPTGPSSALSVFWMLPGKIGTWALISSNSENISLLGFLKPKTAENRALRHLVNRREMNHIATGTAPSLDGELLLLMGATTVMKMAVEMAAVSMEKPSGGTSPSGGCRNRDSCPPDLGFAMAAALEGFAYRGFLRKGFRCRGFI